MKKKFKAKFERRNERELLKRTRKRNISPSIPPPLRFAVLLRFSYDSAYVSPSNSSFISLSMFASSLVLEKGGA